jgi:hypothetical protein
VVKRPRKLKFATILDDVVVAPNEGPPMLNVLFLEEIQAVDCLPTTGLQECISSREVHFLAHISRKTAMVRPEHLVLTDGRFHIVEWEDEDIWDHMGDGSFRNVTVAEYMKRPEPGRPLPGIRNTLFLLDKAIFERYRRDAGFETREVQKRSLLWATNPIDERPPKKGKR